MYYLVGAALVIAGAVLGMIAGWRLRQAYAFRVARQADIDAAAKELQERALDEAYEEGFDDGRERRRKADLENCRRGGALVLTADGNACEWVPLASRGALDPRAIRSNLAALADGPTQGDETASMPSLPSPEKRADMYAGLAPDALEAENGDAPEPLTGDVPDRERFDMQKDDALTDVTLRHISAVPVGMAVTGPGGTKIGTVERVEQTDDGVTVGIRIDDAAALAIADNSPASFEPASLFAKGGPIPHRPVDEFTMRTPRPQHTTAHTTMCTECSDCLDCATDDPCPLTSDHRHVLPAAKYGFAGTSSRVEGVVVVDQEAPVAQIPLTPSFTPVGELPPPSPPRVSDAETTGVLDKVWMNAPVAESAWSAGQREKADAWSARVKGMTA